jgi:uncharacterized membrane protein YfcA
VAAQEVTPMSGPETPALWAAAVAVTLLAGVVKGAIGFAMPLIMISLLTLFLDPKLALAGIILPIVASNGMQVLRMGLAPAWQAMRHHWRYLVVICVAIFSTAQLVPAMSPEVFYLVLGVPVVALSMIQLVGWRPVIPPARRNIAEWGVGTISGILGGLAGTWGPTTVLYLIALQTPKARQIVVQGVIYGVGAVILLLAHLRSGILNGDTVRFSAALLPISLAGMWLGFQLQDRMDAALFRKVTLIVLTVAGLNLIRKGLGL